jgi:hypothetical protein
MSAGNLAAVHRYRARHPDRVRAAFRAWRLQNRRKLALKAVEQSHRRLGYAPGEWDRRWQVQQGRCATCSRPLNPQRWRRGTDRRFLCQMCWWDERHAREGR